MERTELNSLLKSSIQRALLGEIFNELVAVSFDNDELRKLRITYHLDREPTDADYESLSIVSAEVLADVDFQYIEEVCEYTEAPLLGLKAENIAYVRKTKAD